MTDEPTSGVEAALTTLCNAVMADISEAKRRLDADIPKDAPAHPVSAFLTGTALHVGKARAALATPAASPASGVEAVTHADLLHLTQVHRNQIGHFAGFKFVQALEKHLRVTLATPAASPATGDLVSRAEVLRVIRSLGDQDADLAMYGAADNARAREYGEAAATRDCCAIALMPPASPSPAPAAVEELREPVERTLALFFTGNRQPHMRGDPRERVPPAKRRDLSDAADCVLAVFATALSTLAADKARVEAERDAAQSLMGKALRVLGRCHTVLFNMAKENEGAIFNRWLISHEPLRSDARNLLPLIDEVLGHD